MERTLLCCLFSLVFKWQSCMCSGLALRFPVPKETVSVCERQQTGEVWINSSKAEGGQPPIIYNITGGNGFFHVNSTTGQISTVKLLQPQFQSQYVLNKTATDQAGHTADLKVAVIVLKSDQQLRCPNLVREIAPVGEVVGRVRCTADNLQCMKDTVETSDQGNMQFHIITNEGDRNYQPFRVTTQGMVVVSGPLVFRNSIQDMIIMSVKITASRHNATDTNITLNITIEKSDCPSNWTYASEENKYLGIQAIQSTAPLSVEDCKTTCSKSVLPCNGFVYSLVQKRCDLQNETRDTRPDLVRTRLGSRLYRKQCHAVESMPSPELRALHEKVKGNETIEIEDALEICRQIQNFLAFIDDITYMDLHTGTELLIEIAGRSNLTSNGNKSEIFIKNTGAIIDVLLSDRFQKLWIQNWQQGHDNSQILSTFNILSNRIINELDIDLEFASNTTAMYSTFVGSKTQQKVLLGLDLSGYSSVMLPTVTNDTDSRTVRVFVGVLDGIGEIIRANFNTDHISDTGRAGRIVGHVVSVELSPYQENHYTAPFQLDILTPKVDGYIASRRCIFLSRSNQRANGLHWQSEGCWIVFTNLTHTRCHCTHLTNFAILMQVTDFPVSDEQRVSLDVITIAGCCLSIAALTTTVVILLWLRLQSDRYVLLMHLSVALILAQAVFLSAVDLIYIEIVCRMIAILLHYLFVTVFSLMLAQGIQLYHKLHRAFSRELHFTMYLVLGWGTPFILVCISTATNLDGYGTEKHCWLSMKEGAIWAFVGPALTIVCINMVVLVIILRIFLGVRVNAKKKDSDKFFSSIKAALVLLPLLGVTWMFGVLAINNDTVVFQYLFAVLNSLQGLFIFLSHIVFNKEVRRACAGHRGKVMSLTDLAPAD